MQGNVKHGDYLRTLGGAMTAQCKVLHLLSSQSDYPKIVECHIIQSVCYHREALVAAISETRGAPPPGVHVLCRVYKLIRGVQVPGMTPR